MGASKDNEADLIPGIHEYCDRWCDRCPATSRCEIYYRDTRRRGTRIEPDVEGESNLPVRQVGEDSQEVLQVDHPKGKAETRAVPDISDDPLHKAAHVLAIKLHAFLDRFGAALQGERRRELAEDRLLLLQDAFEVLSWYHFQIAVKTDRALQAARSGSAQPADGNAKVTCICLNRCLEALLQIHPMLPSQQSDILPLLETIAALMESLDARFPGHRTLIRPGLDD
jgi:hypothetical protein